MTIHAHPFLEAARRAAANTTGANDDVKAENKGDHWVFEFVPKADDLGGGATVSVAQEDGRIIKVIRGQ